MENDYFELIESELFELTNEEDVKFLEEFSKDGQSLIEKYKDSKYRINFVGEVITPNNIYFSMPKNMPMTKDNILLIKKVLVKYTKDKEGKSLVVSKQGTYSSERAYFNKLKDCFLDFITYEFIYPLKKKLVHSNSPIPGGRVSIIDTVRNRNRFGTGVSYKTKDIENSDDWMLDDIYYHTLKELESKLKISDYEKKQIEDMKNYLNSEGYNLNLLTDGKIKSKKDEKILLDLSNTQQVIEAINKSQVGVIHYPIKNTLIEYYENKQKAIAQPSLDVIFTKNFEKVWEIILQDALMREKSKLFEQREKSKFNKREIEEEFIPSSEVESKKIELGVGIIEPEEVEDLDGDKWIEKRGNRHFLCKKGRLLIPDIFVDVADIFVDVAENRKFIGDAKYYKDPSDSNYDKEFYIYNDAQGHKYPMVIFALPETENLDRTTVPRRGYRRTAIPGGGLRELILITVCVKDVIDDAVNNNTKVLKDSIYLISKYTRKPEWQESEK